MSKRVKGKTASLSSSKRRKSMSKLPLGNVVAFVDVRSTDSDLTSHVSSKLNELGARVLSSFGVSVTHVIFKEGKKSTLQKAMERPVKLVNMLWIEQCHKEKKHVAEQPYAIDPTEEMEDSSKSKRVRSMSPKPLETSFASLGAGETPDATKVLVEDTQAPAEESDPDADVVAASPHHETAITSLTKDASPFGRDDQPKYSRKKRNLKTNKRSPVRPGAVTSPELKGDPNDVPASNNTTTEADQAAVTSDKEKDQTPASAKASQEQSSTAAEGAAIETAKESNNDQTTDGSVKRKLALGKKKSEERKNNTTDVTQEGEFSSVLMDIEQDLADRQRLAPETAPKPDDDDNVKMTDVSSKQQDEDGKTDASGPSAGSKSAKKRAAADEPERPNGDGTALTKGKKASPVKRQKTTKVGGKARAGAAAKKATTSPAGGTKARKAPAKKGATTTPKKGGKKPAKATASKQKDVKKKHAKKEADDDDSASDAEMSQLSDSVETSESESEVDHEDDFIYPKEDGEQENKAANGSSKTSTKAPKGTNKRKYTKTVGSVVLSGFDQGDFSVLESAIGFLGRYRIDDDVSDDTTHVITSGKRTFKVLMGIASGCWIVDKEWVLSSLDKEKWLPEEKFELDRFPGAKTCREERQQRGQPRFTPDVFGLTSGGDQAVTPSQMPAVYVSALAKPSKSAIASLVLKCGAKLARSRHMADVCIGPLESTGRGNQGEEEEQEPVTAPCVTEKWLLDTIAQRRAMPVAQYAAC